MTGTAMHRPLLAISLKASAITLFTVMAAMIKAVSEHVPPGESVFFRSALAIPVILVWLAARGEIRNGLVPQSIKGHVLRGLLGTTAMGLSFAGLAYLPLPEVTAIGYAAPIFTLVLASVMLGERIRAIRISAVAVSLLGVLIMLWPILGGTSPHEEAAALGAALILAATMCRSVVQIHIRQMVQNEHTAAIVFYFSLTATVLSLLTLPFGWVVPTGRELGLLLTAGLLGGIAQILVTSAYRFGSASLLAPYDYTSMLVAIVIGYVWFGDLPTLWVLCGAGLVIAGNGVVIWREHQLGIERAKARSVSYPKP